MSRPELLRITVRFLQPYSHGRGEDGQPEWPPSPLRLFQALVAVGVGREVNTERRAAAILALEALECAPSPEIRAPRTQSSTSSVRFYVPDNIGDKVARSWSAGRSADLAEYRTEKEVRALKLDGEAVHYLYPTNEALAPHVVTIQRMARSLTHLGWGIDMVVGDAALSLDEVSGERWVPGRRGSTVLRAPTAGTLDALLARHDEFLHRLDGGLFRPVPALTRFRAESYARDCDPEAKPYAVFRLLEPLTGDALWLDPVRRARDVAAWMRHAVGELSSDWPFGPTDTLIHGHRRDDATAPTSRFSFLPLPTINPRLGRVEGIRRVLLGAPIGFDTELSWVSARLGGHELVWNGQVVAVLEPLADEDWVARQYTSTSDTWATVTPIVLPGHDDGAARKSEQLIRKAFRQAGFEPSVVDAIISIEWRKVGFLPGTDHASRYLAPDKVTGPLFHLRVRFAAPIAGPIAIGSGRFRGMGVLARVAVPVEGSEGSGPRRTPGTARRHA